MCCVIPGLGPAPARPPRYHQELRQRQERQAQTLASLTAWTVADISKKMGVPPASPANTNDVWWRRLWK
jgi:hypothetical protein